MAIAAHSSKTARREGRADARGVTGLTDAARLHVTLCKKDGGTIEFAIATEVHSDNGTVDLRRTAARRFAENAAVFIAQTTPGTRVLNVDADLTDEANEDHS